MRRPLQLSVLSFIALVSVAAVGCAEEIAVPYDHSRDSTSGGADQTTSTQDDSGDDTSGGGGDVTAPVCGNAAIEGAEQCDNGADNSDTAPDACRADCTAPRCGDGVADRGESCDDGALNNDNDPRACRTNCTRPICGNGVTEGSEQCDSGAGNSDSAPNACRGTCTLPACGDGVVDNGEQCDDGNTIDGDDCANSCVSAMSALCQPCDSDEACGRPIDTCEVGASGSFCAVACDPDAASPCPDGYTCAVDPGEGTRIGKCLPDAGECREVCGNGLDDDADTLIDCADDDCSTTDPRCGAEVCDDGFDNDADTLIDCADPECVGTPACQESCTDNIDNDLDTLTDCADDDCAAHPRCQDACASATACDALPSPTCLDATTRRTFSVSCESNEGVATCAYPPLDTVCPDNGACVNGACVNPCAPSAATVCAAVPAPTCANATTVTTYAPACSAANGQPSCTYPSTSSACPPNQACVGGACVDACNPNPCTNTPPAFCSSGREVTSYSGVCSVSGANSVCNYVPTVTPCSPGNACYQASCVPLSALPQPTQPGQMIFSEIMYYPNRNAQLGQWMELHNTTLDKTFNLGGCYIRKNGNQQFQISVTSNTLVAAPGEFVTLAPSPTATGGVGFVADFNYSSSSFLLVKQGDSSWTSGGTVWLDCSGVTIDQMTYNQSISRGSSLNLDPDAHQYMSNDILSNWCVSSASTYSTSPTAEFGTPGAPNTQCP
jgi:cysteine-rich repeat protein